MILCRLRTLLQQEKRISREEDAALDRDLYRLWNPFPEDWSPEQKAAALPDYVREQERLAREFCAELGIDRSQVDSPAMLERVWEHFEGKRRLVRRSRSERDVATLESKILRTHRFDGPTIACLGRIGAFFGVALTRRAGEGVEWVVPHSDEEPAIDEGRPVLTGLPGQFPEVNPTQVIVTLAHRHMDDSAPGLLKEMVRVWAGEPIHARSANPDDLV